MDKEFWNQVDMDEIKRLDEHWHWNLTCLMNDASLLNADYQVYPAYIRFIFIFKDMVRIDEYKTIGGDENNSVCSIIVTHDDMKFMKQAFRREKKPDTWDNFLRRIGAKYD